MAGWEQCIEKIQDRLTDCRNLANRNQDRVTELTKKKEELAKKLETTVQTRKDTDAQLIKILECNTLENSQ